jgi:hypothetical protein
MFPKSYLYYCVNTPIYYFFIFLIGYILGRANYTLNFYKLGVLLIMFFLLYILTYLFSFFLMAPALYKIRKKYKEDKRRRNILRQLKL